MDETRRFRFESGAKEGPKEVLHHVFSALKGTGYNPINQIVGYLMTGELAYIPRHNKARLWIGKVDRDDLIEELVRSFLGDWEDEDLADRR